MSKGLGCLAVVVVVLIILGLAMMGTLQQPGRASPRPPTRSGRTSRAPTSAAPT